LGVLIPWDRKGTGNQNQRKTPVVAGLVRRGKKPLLRLIGLLVIAGVYWGMKSACHKEVYLHNPEIITEDGTLPAMYARGGLLFLDEKGLSFWSNGNFEIDLPFKPAQAMVAGTGVAYIWENNLHMVFPGHMPEALRSVIANEKFLPYDGQWPVLTFHPSDGGVVGESWVIMATDGRGNITWSAKLPCTPYVAKGQDGYMAVASYDLSSGGSSYLALISAGTGKVYWVKKMPCGFWREIYITSKLAVVCVFDRSVFLYDKDGNMSWSYEFDGDVISAAYDRGMLCVSYQVQGPWYKNLLRKSRVVVLNEAGEICWTRSYRDSNVKAYNTGFAGVTGFAVTGDGFLHILSGLNGAINKRFGFSGIPLYCENGVLFHMEGPVLKSTTLVETGDGRE
jgi:hypothetical protein